MEYKQLKATFSKLLMEKYQGYEDELKRLISICPSEDGRAIYRKGVLHWKTKWLIVQDNIND